MYNESSFHHLKTKSDWGQKIPGHKVIVCRSDDDDDDDDDDARVIVPCTFDWPKFPPPKPPHFDKRICWLSHQHSL